MSTPTLHELIARTGIAEGLTSTESRRLPSAAEIFDAFVYPTRDLLRTQLDQHFEVVALPRSSLEHELHPGDLILRRAEGGLGHAAIVASPERWEYPKLASNGLTPEVALPGHFVHVAEWGPHPHSISEHFARRLTDDSGRLPSDTLVIRPRVAPDLEENRVQPNRSEHGQTESKGTWGESGDILPQPIHDALEKMTDLIFSARHPERDPRAKIKPHEKEPAREWVELRKRVLPCILESMKLPTIEFSTPPPPPSSRSGVRFRA